MSLNLKCGAAVHPGRRFSRHAWYAWGVQWELLEPGPEARSALRCLFSFDHNATILQQTVILSVHSYFSHQVIFLVAAACSREALVINRRRATHTNANVEWHLSKEQAESSSRKQYNTHGPPQTKATPHQGFIKVLERLGPITSLPLHWNSQGLNCPSLPVAACIMSSNCSSSVTRGFRDGRGALRTLNL